MASGGPTLEEKIAFLGDPGSYPADAGPVECVETHMSWVFLTKSRVYKLKKPVRFPYLDFSSLAAREAMCREEVRLNRRLAADVYLGAVPLRATAQGLSLGGERGRIADWLVVMRRLDAAAMLDRRIADGRLRPADFMRVAAALSDFYRRARRQLMPPGEQLARWRRSLAVDREGLSSPGFALPRRIVRRVDRVLRLFLARRGALLAARARSGRIVDGHGDLRPEHICVDSTVRIIDRLEFNAQLRRVDPLEELAYLSLECRRLGAAWGGEIVRAAVSRALADDASEELFLFYRCHCAALRARLAIAHTLDGGARLPEKWPRLARAHLDLAFADALRLERLIMAPACRRGCVPRGAGGRRRPAAARRARRRSSG